MGVECKVFVHPSILGTKLDSTAGEIAEQLSRYFDAGVARAIVATKLTEDDSKQLESKVNEVLPQRTVGFDRLEVVHRSFQKLLSVLNEEIKLALV